MARRNILPTNAHVPLINFKNISFGLLVSYEYVFPRIVNHHQDLLTSSILLLLLF
jgi:hypothetical protein